MYVKKITQCLCKIEKFELEVVGMGISGTGICFQGSH